MLNLIIIVHNITFDTSHALIIYITNIPKLELLDATAITIDYYWLTGVGCVKVAFVKHVFDSKEF